MPLRINTVSRVFFVVTHLIYTGWYFLNTGLTENSVIRLGNLGIREISNYHTRVNNKVYLLVSLVTSEYPTPSRASRNQFFKEEKNKVMTYLNLLRTIFKCLILPVPVVFLR
jgi:hypothetical protein